MNPGMGGGGQMGSGMNQPQRFPAGAAGNSKQALQNMLRARHTAPNQFNQFGNNPAMGMGNQMFQQRQGYPVRPNMRMHQPNVYASQGGGGNNMGMHQGNQFSGKPGGPAAASGGGNMNQFGGFNNQMGGMNNQYMMRSGQPGNYSGGQQGMMNRTSMMNQQQQGNYGMNRPAYMQQQQNVGMVGGNAGGYRPAMPMSSQAMQGGNMGMRMPQQQGQMQNPQLMAQLQRGNQGMGGNNFNQQQRF